MSLLRLVKIIYLIAIINCVSSKYKCPIQCTCDINNGLRRARCIAKNMISVNVGLPSHLEEYNLHGNLITRINGNAFENKALIRLDLSSNSIFSINLHAFAGLENLQYLNLSKNRLQEIAPDLFWYNKKLDILDISKNNFRSIQNQPFLIHSNLKMLDLSDSQISHLPENVFQKLPSLAYLDLSKNFMIELQINILSPLKNLKFLSLEGNNWSCNMIFSELQVWIIKQRIEYNTQCMVKPKTHEFEKIISAVATEDNQDTGENQDIDELWNIEDEEIHKNNVSNDNRIQDDSLINHYNMKIPSFFSLVIGLILGLMNGMLITYCWLAKVCSCEGFTWKSRRERLREIRMGRRNDIRDVLLTNPHYDMPLETPPLVRRHQQNPSGFTRSLSWEAAPLVTFTPTPRPRLNSPQPSQDEPVLRNRPETPPPPYGDCINDAVFTNN